MRNSYGRRRRMYEAVEDVFAPITQALRDGLASLKLNPNWDLYPVPQGGDMRYSYSMYAAESFADLAPSVGVSIVVTYSESTGKFGYSDLYISTYMGTPETKGQLGNPQINAAAKNGGKYFRDVKKAVDFFCDIAGEIEEGNFDD